MCEERKRSPDPAELSRSESDAKLIPECGTMSTALLRTHSNSHAFLVSVSSVVMSLSV